MRLRLLAVCLGAALLTAACRPPDFSPVAMQPVSVSAAQRPVLLARLRAFAAAENLQYAPSPFPPMIASLTGRNVMITVTHIGGDTPYFVGYTRRPYVQPVATTDEVRALSQRLATALSAPPGLEVGETDWPGDRQGGQAPPAGGSAPHK